MGDVPDVSDPDTTTDQGAEVGSSVSEDPSPSPNADPCR
jgi:hypothetical protein